jgi:membrane-bound serine protease (ClpP class)
MGLVVVALLAFAFLEPPWRFVAIAAAALWELFEIALWLRWRKRKSITGIETLIGTRGRAVTDCRPTGQVSVRGQLWRAECPEGVDEGDEIVVTAMDGLRMTVAPASSRDQGQRA